MATALAGCGPALGAARVEIIRMNLTLLGMSRVWHGAFIALDRQRNTTIEEQEGPHTSLSGRDQF